jgi:hypothetical protein
MSFVDRLDESEQRVNDWALLLEQQGHRVYLPPRRRAPKREQWRAFQDPCDIKAAMRLEHKGRTLAFTDRKKDFPFADVIVNETYKIEGQESWPALMHVMASDDGEYAAVVYGWTKKHWFKKWSWDKTQQEWRLNWHCPLQYVLFCRKDEVLSTPLPDMPDPPKPKYDPPAKSAPVGDDAFG